MTTRMTATEVYFLLLSCYLHDAGMVVSDAEKLEILGSPEWARFVETDKVIADDITLFENELRTTGGHLGAEETLFVAGLKQRWLLAEYFRKIHADRVRVAISGPLKVRERYLGDDHSAEETLTAICAGHGLSRSELGRDSHYPTQRDHFGEQVDVRFLSILLRLGDLLDMRPDRACLLRGGGSTTIPKSSVPHLEQYKRIKSQATSPTHIRLNARCETAEEHRVLADWCRWIVDEIREAPHLLATSERHGTWRPPAASLGSADSTMVIERAPGSHYRAIDWRFIFDEAEVVTRLVRDVHGSSLGYLRELLQNCLDATRTRALDAATGKQRYSNLLNEDVRKTMEIGIVLHLEEEDGSINRIDFVDSGVGMTEEIVQNYFLQIGRSWYRSAEFRESYSFAPTSRFGVGFLSVFSVARMVRVETRWHQNPADSALKMGIAGPRSYLLLEDAVRQSPGTTVEVELESPVNRKVAESAIADLCVAVEFPVAIYAAVGTEVVLQERFFGTQQSSIARWTYGSSSDEVVILRLEVVQLSTDGVFGTFEFIVREDGAMEDWSLDRYGLERLIQKVDPLAPRPVLESSWTAINGLRATADGGRPLRRESIVSERYGIDIRRASAAASRGLDRERPADVKRLAGSALSQALSDHLNSQTRSWEYVSAVARRFLEYAPLWARAQRCIPTSEGLLSVADLGDRNCLLLTDTLKDEFGLKKGQKSEARQRLEERSNEVLGWVEDSPVALTHVGLSALGAELGRNEVYGRMPSRGWDDGDGIISLHLTEQKRRVGRSRFTLCPFPSDSALVSAWFNHELSVINSEHPLIKAVQELGVGNPELVTRLYENLSYPSSDVDSCVAAFTAASKRSESSKYGKLARDLKKLTFMEGHEKALYVAVGS